MGGDYPKGHGGALHLLTDSAIYEDSAPPWLCLGPVVALTKAAATGFSLEAGRLVTHQGSSFRNYQRNFCRVKAGNSYRCKEARYGAKDRTHCNDHPHRT